MTDQNPKAAAAAEKRPARLSLFMSIGFICVVGCLSTANPVLTLMGEVVLWIVLLTLLPTLRNLKYLPRLYFISQSIYRTTEPAPRLSMMEERRMRRQLREFSFSEERRP